MGRPGRTHAPDDATRDAILANPLYQNITGKFVQSHDYIAMERLYEIHASGRYDLIVVDTPPTRNAIDFLEAPERMADFFSSRLLRWLIAPYRSRLYNAASKPFYLVADRILGSQFLADIAEFFILFQTMYDGFVERAEAVTRTLQDRRTTFMVVSTLEAAPAREAEFFIDALEGRGFHLGAVVLNKVLPDYLVDRGPHVGGPGLAKDPDAVAERWSAARSTCPPGPTWPWSAGCCGRWARASSTTGGRHPGGRAAGRAGPQARDRRPVPYFDSDIPTWPGCCAWATRSGGSAVELTSCARATSPPSRSMPSSTPPTSGWPGAAASAARSSGGGGPPARRRLRRHRAVRHPRRGGHSGVRPALPLGDPRRRAGLP